MRKLFFLGVSLSGLFLISCNKKDSNSGSITGKWTHVKAIDWVTFEGTTFKDTADFPSTAYSDFRTDGKVYTYNAGVGGGDDYDTSTYEVKGSMLILQNINSDTKDTATINKLDGHNMELYTKYTDVDGTEETWITFKK